MDYYIIIILYGKYMVRGTYLVYGVSLRVIINLSWSNM